MGFLGIGAMEAMVIIVIALIIFGPGRLPTMMGEAGRAVRDFRRATQDLTSDFRESYDEVRETVDELQTDMRQTARDLENETQSIARSFNETVTDATDINKPTAKCRSAPRPAKKLDQLEEGEEAPELPAQAASEPTPKPAERARASKPQPAQSDDVLSGDDLLAAESDADDLLALDDDADDVLSLNGASAKSKSSDSTQSDS